MTSRTSFTTPTTSKTEFYRSEQRPFAWINRFTRRLVCLLPMVFYPSNSLLSQDLNETEPPATESATTLSEQSIQIVEPYRLDSIVVRGSSRLSAIELNRALSLSYGEYLDDRFVMNTRAKLLGLGVYSNVTLYLKKGRKKGWAKLYIDVEDDPNVLGKWAIGSSVAVVQSEKITQNSSPDNAPLGYKIGVISRNLFSSLHRSTLNLDLDSKGVLREGSIAYGLPRFAAEETQFDASYQLVDVQQRYLNAKGFGRKTQGIWSKTLTNQRGILQYGGAMYLNQNDRFSMPGFPSIIAGPKIGYGVESRLHTFIPGEGQAYHLSLLLSPIDMQESIFEADFEHTLPPFSGITTTMHASGYGIINGAYGLRAELRFDAPFHQVFNFREPAQVYVRFRTGQDSNENANYNGSAAILGIRYHSSGFIAEFAIQITASPKELEKVGPSLTGGSGSDD